LQIQKTSLLTYTRQAVIQDIFQSIHKNVNKNLIRIFNEIELSEWLDKNFSELSGIMLDTVSILMVLHVRLFFDHLGMQNSKIFFERKLYFVALEKHF
jgi:hypothetical protein